MADIRFDSDAARHGGALRFVKSVTFDGPVSLERGGWLPEVTVAYETWGRISAAGDNAVLVCHAITGDSHVARHEAGDDPGWWDIFVGPGRPIDTDRYFVVCPNILGGCRGTTGPGSRNPATDRPHGGDFPTITIGDMVEVQRRLADALGITAWLAVVGGSMGGQQALEWATRCPDRVRSVVALATAGRLSSQALAFDVVGRNCIRADPRFRAGHYYDSGDRPDDGLALARMIGHVTYLSREAMAEKFDADRLHPRAEDSGFEQTFSVGSYLGHQGRKFLGRFDANSYLALSTAMDLFDLGGTPEALEARLRPAVCDWLVISFSSDWLFPPEQSRELVETMIRLGQRVDYRDVVSNCGHDAFLLPDNIEVYGTLTRDFLHSRWQAGRRRMSARRS